MDQSPTLLAFEENPNFSRLEQRRFSFYKMVEHLEKSTPGLIIETGTAWLKDSWEGQGQSTLIWDWACEKLNKHTAISVDLNPEAAKMSGDQTKFVKYITADSVQTLNSLPTDHLEVCRLLYLDSFDWSPELNLESAFHHIAELATVWAKLPSGCLIVVDDRHAPMQGKHFMVEFFMEKLGIKPFFSGYQMGWIKP